MAAASWRSALIGFDPAVTQANDPPRAFDQLRLAAKRMAQSRQALLAFQNREGLVSPTGTVTDIAAVAAATAPLQAKIDAARKALVDAALKAGSWDNASALVIHVRELAALRLEDVLLGARQLPVPARLKVGDALAG